MRAGALLDSQGRSLRLMGLHSDGADLQRDLRDLQGVLQPVAEGLRCVSVPVHVVAQLTPAALLGLEAAIAAHAAAGAYTLLRIDARLWLHGHHLKLARRLAGHSAVMYALLGREKLADKLAHAALAMRQLQPGACVWLPLESARAVFALHKDLQLGLLWDAVRPQAPRGAGLAGSLRAPVLLDGWQPGPQHALADERLARLCREAGIGWLVRNASPLLQPQRGGLAAPSRAALSLQRVLLQALAPDECSAWPQAA
jgi:hypothetical protein